MKRKIDLFNFTVAIVTLIVIATLALTAALILNPELIGEYLGQIINAVKSTQP